MELPPYPAGSHNQPPISGGSGMPPVWLPPSAAGRHRRRWLGPLLTLVAAAIIALPLILTAQDDETFGLPKVPTPPPAALYPPSTWHVLASSTPAYRNRLGAWTFEGGVIVATDRHVIARSHATAKTIWRFEAPRGKSFCGVGGSVVDNRLALAFGDSTGQTGTICDTTTVLNVESGQLAWSQPLYVPQQYRYDIASSAALEIIGQTVVVAQGEGVVGLDVRSGQQLWGRTVARNVEDEPQSCLIGDLSPADNTGDKSDKIGRVVLALSCSDGSGGSASADFGVLSLDSRVGSVVQEKYVARSTLGLSTVDHTMSLVSTNPVVAYVRDTQNRFGYVIFDPAEDKVQFIDGGIRGEPQSLSTMDETGLSAGRGTLHRPAKAVVLNGLLITVTETMANPTKYPDHDANMMVAFDMKTGQRRWQAQAEGIMVAPVKVDDQQVVAPVSMPITEPPQVVQINAQDGAIKVLGTYPVNEPISQSLFVDLLLHKQFLWWNGRMYGVVARHQGSPTLGDGLEVFALG